jgi:hypothetical protein
MLPHQAVKDMLEELTCSGQNYNFWLYEYKNNEEKLLQKVLSYGYVLRSDEALKNKEAVLNYAIKSPLCACLGFEADYLPFFALQLSRYLQYRGHFESRSEEVMINDLIREGYEETLPLLQYADKQKKLELYRTKVIYFPFSGRRPSFYNFKKGRPYYYTDSCPCGSGFVFGECCGLF